MKSHSYQAVGLLAAVLLLSLPAETVAQRRINTRFAPYSSVSFGVGSSHYYGDLAGYRRPIRSTYIMPRWNVGLGYTRQFTPQFAARAMFTWARISGDDYTFNRNNPQANAIQYVRNLHFRNDLKEFAVTGIYNFVADGRNSNYRAKLTPYLFGGIALLAHSPEARTPVATDGGESRRWVKLQPLRTEGQGQPGFARPYSLVTAAIPVGLGVRYMLNENFNVGFEVGYRYTFTDYLDDVGGPYAPATNLVGLGVDLADRRLEERAARVNEDRNLSGLDQTSEAFTTTTRGAAGILRDGYVLTSFQIHYIIPGRIKCPPIK